jgi:ketosteroid isomerase-like protein
MLTKPIALVSLTLIAAACAPVPLTDADRAAIAKEVTEALGELTAAMNDHDPESVVSFYAEDPDFLYLGCTDYVTGGTNFRQMAGPTYSARSDVMRGSSTETEALFWTQVLVKRDGRWLITYEHESWPGCNPPGAPHPMTGADESAMLLPGIGS